MSTITWLHLSDLHFRRDKLTKWNQDIVLQALLEDVRGQMADEGLRPDFIVVSGDIAYSGATKEYALAETFFNDLLDVTGLDENRLFVVPGNHDADRGKIDFAVEAIEKAIGDRDSLVKALGSAQARQPMFKRLAGYARFIKKYFGDRLPLDGTYYSYVKSLDLSGRKVAVLGLNSAWAAHGGDVDYGKLLLGERQVRPVVESPQVKEAFLRLAVMHHPFEWLNDFDRKDCEPLLMQNCQFILRGHLHRTDLTQLSTPDERAMILAAGASFEERRHRNAYNITQLDFAVGTGTVYLRVYSDERGGFWAWDTTSYRNVKNGKFEFKLSAGDGEKRDKPIIVPLEPVEPARDREAEKRYLDYLVERYQYLDFRGMGVSDRVPLRLPLAEMYVPLKARVELPKGETHDHERIFLAGRRASVEEIESMGERLSKPQPLLKLLNDNEGLVILGDPGAGKTTFLKYLTLKLAMEQGGELGLENRLPVLVPLSEYANALAKEDVRLDRFVRKYYDDLVIGLPVGAMLNVALNEGRALVLLDGLDEVKEQSRRQDVVKRVEHFFASAKRQGNKFVMTSRIVGYREVRPSAKGLEECTLDDFNDEDIAEFLAKWSAALEKAARGDTAFAAGEAERERRELQNALNRNVGVRRLASNPLLLTILALMKRQGVVLPERRVELYQKYIETLLKNWNLARGLGRAPERDLDVVETVRVLAPLALWMHETSPGVGLVKREDVRRRLEKIYRKRKHSEPEKATKQLLDDVRDYAGLLLERGPGMYGFIHLTFQEYLAATAVALVGQQSVKPLVRVLKKHVGDDNWHEVFLLAIAYLGIIQQRDQAAGDTLQRLIEPPAGAPGVAAVWAGEAVLDAGSSGVTPTCREKVIEWLKDAMRDEKVKPVTRAAAGRALAKLGDTRPGAVGLLQTEGKAAVPDMELCLVPAGPFWMGEGEGEHLNESLTYDYWIGRYPVTVAQFRCFTDGGGYEERKWWPEAKAAGVWRDGKVKGRWDETWRKGPYDYGEPYNLPNHPVVGVTWYEALAFTRWLTARWLPPSQGGQRGVSVLPAGWEVRLPSEAEWEKAARGGLQIPEKPVIIRVGGDPHPGLPPTSGVEDPHPGLPPTSGVEDPHPGLPPSGGRKKNPNVKRRYPWGDDPDPNWANYADTGIGTTSAVGCFPGGASLYGCEDMSGNVWEWTRSLGEEKFGYPYVPGDGRERLDAGNDVLRVLRGASFSNDVDLVRCARRSGLNPLGHVGNNGFRAVAAPIPLASGPSGSLDSGSRGKTQKRGV